MPITLALVRHGRAGGQGLDADLLPEGAGYVATLGRRLRREGWTAEAGFSSPYLRARETLRILLEELASDATPRRLPELAPDHDPERTLDALVGVLPPAGRVLVVAHMPLLGRLAVELTGEPIEFFPGTLAEVALDAPRRRGVLVRRIGPDEL